MESQSTTVVTDKYRGTKEYLLVYLELIQAARYRGTITYQDVASIMGLPSTGAYMAREVGHLVGSISEDEHNHGRPLLSAIVVNAQGKVGSGFYELARRLGKLPEDGDELAFWEAEKAAIYSTWAKPKP